MEVSRFDEAAVGLEHRSPLGVVLGKVEVDLDRTRDLDLSEGDAVLAVGPEGRGLGFEHHGGMTDVVIHAEVAPMIDVIGRSKRLVEEIHDVLAGVEHAARFWFQVEMDADAASVFDRSHRLRGLDQLGCREPDRAAAAFIGEVRSPSDRKGRDRGVGRPTEVRYRACDTCVSALPDVNASMTPPTGLGPGSWIIKWCALVASSQSI